jgi:hypothetical protein
MPGKRLRKPTAGLPEEVGVMRFSPIRKCLSGKDNKIITVSHTVFNIP